jgi:F0F1-type ATP synthase epsilon subunit
MKKLAKQLVLVAKGIFKLNDSQRKIITYIGVRVEDVSRRFAHEAKAGEVIWLALDLLILL